MVRAAHLRNFLEASLKVRSMCVKLDSVLRSERRFSMYIGEPGIGFSILISLQIGTCVLQCKFFSFVIFLNLKT
jgi:hypothetical protein